MRVEKWRSFSWRTGHGGISLLMGRSGPCCSGSSSRSLSSSRRRSVVSSRRRSSSSGSLSSGFVGGLVEVLGCFLRGLGRMGGGWEGVVKDA